MKTLVQIQNELKVPKGNFNSFGKYHYRSTEDILEAVKPILAKYEVILTVTDNIQLIGDKFFLVATATLIFSDAATISVNGFAEIGEHKGMSSEQQTGTASSYARKYALNGLFLIDETAADADSQPPPAQTKTSNGGLPTLERIRNAEKAIRDLGGQVEGFNPTGKNQDDLKAELEALNEQYKRLIKTKQTA